MSKLESKNDDLDQLQGVNYDEHGNAEALESSEKTAETETADTKTEKKLKRKKAAKTAVKKGPAKKTPRKKGAVSKLLNAVDNEDDEAVSSSRIVSISGNLEAESEEARRTKLLTELADSLRTRRTLKAIFDGVERSQTGIPHAIVHYGNLIRVVIPYNEFLKTSDYENADNPSSKAELLLNKRLGSQIDFIVCGSNQDAGVVVASRLAAMTKERYENYLRPDKNGKFIIEEGKDVEARVVIVNQKSVVVEIHGVETFISPEELAWGRLFDATEKFSVGKNIIVRVMSLDKSDTDNIKISVSARLTTNNVQKTAAKECVESGKYIGDVADVGKDGFVYVKFLNGGFCRCQVSDSCERPARKDRVTVKVKHIDLEHYWIDGLITHVSSMRR